MAESRLTLKRFFFERGADVREAIEKSSFGSLFRNAFSNLPSTSQKMLASDFDSRVEAALDLDLIDILIGGWKKYSQLQQFRDRVKYPPDESFFLSLTEHAITSSHRITVEILAGEVTMFALPLDAIAVLTIEGITLKVRDARICEISSGRCRGKGTLKLREMILVEKETPYLELPGRIDLGYGIEIPGS